MGKIPTVGEMLLLPEEGADCIIEPGLLPLKGIMAIAGEPGVGKSYLALQIYLQILAGERVLGLFPSRKFPRPKVVYFEAEKRNELARGRLLGGKTMAKYGHLTQNMGYYDQDMPQLDKPSGVADMVSWLQDFGAQLAIIDSFSVSVDDDRDLKNQRRLILGYREVAKLANVAIIVVTQLSKRKLGFNQDGKEVESPLRIDNMRGSKFLAYEVDTILGLTKVKGAGPGRGKRVQNINMRELSFLKHSFCPAPLEDYTIKLSFNANDMPEAFRPMDSIPQILEYLDTTGPSPISSISTDLNIPERTLFDIKDSLEGMGLVTYHQGVGGYIFWSTNHAHTE